MCNAGRSAECTFANGAQSESTLPVAVTGLLEIMNDDELEGVIAHELAAHVRNYDILTSSIAATIAGAITFMASMGKWAMIFGGFGRDRDDDRGGGGLAALLMIFPGSVCGFICCSCFCRRRASTRQTKQGHSWCRTAVWTDQRSREAWNIQPADPDARRFRRAPLPCAS